MRKSYVCIFEKKVNLINNSSNKKYSMERAALQTQYSSHSSCILSVFFLYSLLRMSIKGDSSKRLFLPYQFHYSSFAMLHWRLTTGCCPRVHTSKTSRRRTRQGDIKQKGMDIHMLYMNFDVHLLPGNESLSCLHSTLLRPLRMRPWKRGWFLCLKKQVNSLVLFPYTCTLCSISRVSHLVLAVCSNKSDANHHVDRHHDNVW